MLKTSTLPKLILTVEKMKNQKLRSGRGAEEMVHAAVLLGSPWDMNQVNVFKALLGQIDFAADES